MHFHINAHSHARTGLCFSSSKVKLNQRFASNNFLSRFRENPRPLSLLKFRIKASRQRLATTFVSTLSPSYQTSLNVNSIHREKNTQRVRMQVTMRLSIYIPNALRVRLYEPLFLIIGKTAVATSLLTFERNHSITAVWAQPFFIKMHKFRHLMVSIADKMLKGLVSA